MRLDIYVNHRGHCEQAFRLYEQHLGCRITGIVRRVFDRVIGLEQVPDAYRAMHTREAIKVMVKP